MGFDPTTLFNAEPQDYLHSPYYRPLKYFLTFPSYRSSSYHSKIYNTLYAKCIRFAFLESYIRTGWIMILYLRKILVQVYRKNFEFDLCLLWLYLQWVLEYLITTRILATTDFALNLHLFSYPMSQHRREQWFYLQVYLMINNFRQFLIKKIKLASDTKWLKLGNDTLNC